MSQALEALGQPNCICIYINCGQSQDICQLIIAAERKCIHLSVGLCRPNKSIHLAGGWLPLRNSSFSTQYHRDCHFPIT